MLENILLQLLFETTFIRRYVPFEDVVVTCYCVISYLLGRWLNQNFSETRFFLRLVNQCSVLLVDLFVCIRKLLHLELKIGLLLMQLIVQQF